MLRIPALAIGTLFAAILLFTAVTSDVTQDLEATRTDSATDSGLNCTTNPGETTCAVTLVSGEHQWSDTAFMTVTRTFPSSEDDTAASTLGTDRETVTIAGLTPSTTYSWDIDYLILNPDIAEMPFIGGWLHTGQWWMPLAGFIIAMLAMVKVGEMLAT